MPRDRVFTTQPPRRRRIARRMAVALPVVVVLSLVRASALALPGPPGGDGPPVIGPYQPPVVAPVVDGFRPPANPYGPGNRGIDYATEPGTPVGAAGDGVVTFAGPVAGALHVTVLHPDGIRTSYSFLAAVLVSQGQRVARGQPVGLAGPRLQVGARTGPRRYIDPAGLWGQHLHVWLVPLDGAGAGGRMPDSAPSFGSQEAPDPYDVTDSEATLAQGAGGLVAAAATRLPG